MVTLCMDTSHTWLAIALLKDDSVLGYVQESCWKKQSEEIFPQLIALMEKHNVAVEDIQQVVISKGPGSYTGVRIAMTIAKVFCAMGNVPLYTVSSLQLYAGLEDCRVVTDARGKRIYTGRYNNGKLIGKEAAMAIEDFVEDAPAYVGDAELIGKESNWPNIAENFLALKNDWHLEENVHLVVPEYLKSSDSYLPNKK